MKVKEIDESVERQIVTYAITSTKFLREIRPALIPAYMRSGYAKIVIKWVVEYFEEYKEAPGKHIQDLYKKNLHTIRDEEETELVSEFLLRLSKDYEAEEVGTGRENVEFLVRTAISYLKLRALEDLKDHLEASILEHDPVKGEQCVTNFRRVETPRDKGVSLLDDTTTVTTAFIEEEDTLFHFPGVLGEQVGSFVRGDLVAYMAASKRGKSWWEWYTGQTALYHGFRVAFFNLEMTRNQQIRRSWMSLVSQPRRRREYQELRDVSIPSFYREGENGVWMVKAEKKDVRTIDPSEVGEKQKAFRRQFRSGSVRVFSLPAYSATVLDIQAHLDNLIYYDNFIPDVIVVDYADLIAPAGQYRGEYRHQLDEIWKSLRRIAQERNALVVTATQAGRAAFVEDADEKDIAEDIRKIAHVAKLIVINQKRSEKDIGVCRVQQLVERDDHWGGQTVLVLQCLDLGQVCLASKLKKDVFLPKDEQNERR